MENSERNLERDSERPLSRIVAFGISGQSLERDSEGPLSRIVTFGIPMRTHRSDSKRPLSGIVGIVPNMTTIWGVWGGSGISVRAHARAGATERASE